MLRAGRPGQGGQEVFLYLHLSTASKAALELHGPLIYAHEGTLSLGVKRVGHEADHSPPSSSEANNGGTIPLLFICLSALVLN
jgi:hypothetical protein